MSCTMETESSSWSKERKSKGNQDEKGRKGSEGEEVGKECWESNYY